MKRLLNIRPDVAARHGAGRYLYLTACCCYAIKPYFLLS
ncbi:hypothetical protein APHNP_1824 [Anaplasma phagocytophilum str. ApNP]|uniref:Uncharacterized protein n=1 Tax=Anaplasma phagocytophilum str. ApNP TaxID=1359153 RepID=A0A0F3NEY5_ANAPH|nr:hypothetical protein APHNP_1824 [Anaplasma phagocytophilum str. ApNP]